MDDLIEGIQKIVRELLGKSDGAFINPPFYCDYGSHIEVGKNFFANYNCTILDVGKVRIGDNVQFAPNVSVYTAGHPVQQVIRDIQPQGTHSMNMAWILPSEIMFGSVGMLSYVRV